MKKLMMIVGLTFGLMAGGNISPVVPVDNSVTNPEFTPYFGTGSAYAVDAKDYYGLVLAGIEYKGFIGIEGRYYTQFDKYGDVLGIYIKPKYTFNNGVGVYGLLGGERTYLKNITVDSWAAGGGVEYKNFFVDGVYNDKFDDTKVVVGYRIRF